MGLDIAVIVEASEWETACADITDICRTTAETAWQFCDQGQSAELSIMLSDDDHIRALNARFRDKDTPTNVLSFPGDPPAATDMPWLLGDIVLAYRTITREAERDGKSMSAHVRHLVVHGLLHLLGYDHQNSREAAEMEALEIAILAQMDVADPYRLEPVP